jgi:signal transduction histidine kinase/DNA-binding response OmpR family regulator
MKLKFKSLVTFFVLIVAACIGMGLLFSYRVYSTSKQQLSSITVSTKQKAHAFELAKKVLILEKNSKERKISEAEMKDLKALIFRWDLAQKALVNGDESFGLVRPDSKQLVSAIQSTSESYVAVVHGTKELLYGPTPWDEEKVRMVNEHVEAYADKVNDLIVLVNKESDSLLSVNLISLCILSIIGVLGVLGGALILIRPLIRKVVEADMVKETATGELESVRSEKIDFLSHLSNELRTPLNGIIGMSDLLLKTKLDEEQIRYSKSIRTGSARLMDIITDIGDHARMETGELEIEKDSFEFTDTMEQVMDLMRPLAMEKGLELVLDVDQRIPLRLIQDERRLRQVLISIVNNAIKFTERGEVVTQVELLNQESGFVQLKFSIADTGIGMDAHKQRRLFSISSNSSDEVNAGSGTGLGLFISKKLIDKMGGRIWVDSAPSKGTKVSFTLVAESEGTIALSKISSLNGKKALIVDDNKTNLKILVKQLSSYGIQAIPFNSPDLVEDMIGSLTRFDFAILDMEMPKVTGVSLAEKIREKYPREVLPMIAISQSGNKIFQDKGILFDAYLTKPVKMAKLLEILVSILDHKTFDTTIRGQHEGAFSKNHLNILVAHGNELTRAVAVKNLSLMGHKCSEANSGDQIIELTAKSNYDLLLVDTEVQELKGLEAIKKLRQITRDEKMPLIVGLVDNPELDKKKVNLLGVDALLHRKIDTEEVQKTIEEWFEVPS